VLIAIARMAALSVAGVRSVGRLVEPTRNLFRHRTGEGVRLSVHESLISGDIYLVVKDGFNIRDVGRDVQQQVARALQEMVGMGVARLDIHVENIVYDGTGA
jgi:uncharacterized alkaline shock family protein YloU